MQIPHYLIQRRRKTRVHIQEHAIQSADLQNPPQIANHLLEPLCATNAADLLPQRRGAPDGHEPYRDLRRGELAGDAQGRGSVAGKAGEDHGGREREGKVIVLELGVGDSGCVGIVARVKGGG